MINFAHKYDYLQSFKVLSHQIISAQVHLTLKMWFICLVRLISFCSGINKQIALLPVYRGELQHSSVIFSVITEHPAVLQSYDICLNTSNRSHFNYFMCHWTVWLNLNSYPHIYPPSRKLWKNSVFKSGGYYHSMMSSIVGGHLG